MNQNTFNFQLEPELEKKIHEIHTMFLEFTRSGKTALSHDWLQIVDIAEILGVSTKTVRRRITENGLKGKKLGRKWYFHISEVERLLGLPGSE